MIYNVSISVNIVYKYRYMNYLLGYIFSRISYPCVYIYFTTMNI